MEEVRALNASKGQGIYDILEPTFKIYGALLAKPENKAAILTIPSTTESYGPHPRQKLDVYRALDDCSSTPILVFFYGGGLVRGDKISPQFNLVYHNFGAFFASRGITTIIPDYRRVNSHFGGEDAVFPSGGEDVSLALKWVEKFDTSTKRTVFIMGNSAGGVHISTFLFEPSFFAQREEYVAGKSRILLKGAIELAVPLHFGNASTERSSMLMTYYGSEQGYRAHCPYGLMETIAKSGKSRKEAGVPKVMVLLGEFDPDNDIVKPVKEFVELWKRIWGDVDCDILKGHNHISPPWALMAGEPAGEKWGEDLAKWIKN
ncbi:hypothetical protein LAWI1_G007699 [Lachnellula willkommii]|uniref:BD-FAE-like domain-containing protein n=1 Tax=Lachnellula willkommii TaxID=215461 RepID=A0A559M760_9HELO|nr:hypothetical protein LAWI1_G007699 [Lachnellula willkommii]